MKELLSQIKDLKNKIEKLGEHLDIAQKKQKILEMEEEMTKSDFWQDQKRATKIAKDLAFLKEEIEKWENLSRQTDELLDLVKLTEKEKDEKAVEDLENKLTNLIKGFKKLEFFILLSGKYDEGDAILAIHAGTGGVDAQDWAEILLRMYLRFSEKKGFKVKTIDLSRGSEAGIKSAVLEIQGKFAYGYLKTEAGVHRLVRISPFDAEKMRHTSFALVEVLPELEEIEEIKIKDNDLKIDTFLSSGPGGQGVQTTYSAVRIVHQPTKITVTCQNERSQKQNKETALKILKSKLHQYYQAKKEEEKQRLRGEFHEASWGSQIRSYVLHPYKMVKDHRTDLEKQEVEKVLDGDLEPFIEAYLSNIKIQ